MLFILLAVFVVFRIIPWHESVSLFTLCSLNIHHFRVSPEAEMLGRFGGSGGRWPVYVGCLGRSVFQKHSMLSFGFHRTEREALELLTNYVVVWITVGRYKHKHDVVRKCQPWRPRKESHILFHGRGGFDAAVLRVPEDCFEFHGRFLKCSSGK